MVVVGYGVQKKVNLTGSVSVVESEDLVGRSSSNTSNLLVCVVPNMNVTNDNGRFTFHSPAVSTDFETRGYYSAAIVDYFSRQLKGQNFTNYELSIF